VVSLYKIKDVQQRQMLLREIEIIKLLDHPNTVKVFEVFQTLNTLYIVMEVCSGGELFDRMCVPSTAVPESCVYARRTFVALVGGGTECCADVIASWFPVRPPPFPAQGTSSRGTTLRSTEAGSSPRR